MGLARPKLKALDDDRLTEEVLRDLGLGPFLHDLVDKINNGLMLGRIT